MAKRTLYPSQDGHNWSASDWSLADDNAKDQAKPIAGDTVVTTANSGTTTQDENTAALAALNHGGGTIVGTGFTLSTGRMTFSGGATTNLTLVFSGPADFIYTLVKEKLLEAGIDLVNDDIRVLLVMTNTTVDTEEDKEFIGDFTTLDEMDGANYVRKALANEAVVADTAKDRGEFDADDVTWSALGAGTRSVQGALVYKHVTNDADSIPLLYLDSGGFPFAASGADVTIQWDLQGILQAT